MKDEYDVIISKEQAEAFALAISGSIAEYIKTHQAEYELFLLEEKEMQSHQCDKT